MSYVYPFIVISGWLTLILTFSALSTKFFPKETELSRKIVHIGSGPIIPLAWWLNIESYVAIPVALIITIGLIINYQLRFFSSIEQIERKSFGTIAYGFSITLLLFLFWDTRPDAVTAGVMMMAFGDGLAGLIGQKIQSPYWLVLGQKKSLAGTSTMGLIGVIILLIISRSTSIPIELIDVIQISTLAVLVEQFSPFGLDNITIPLGTAISWNFLI